MKSRSVLVIGGNGFIGRNICDYLVNKGDTVFSFDIQEPSITNSKVNYVIGDFFDDENLLSAIADMDVIIHSLSTVNPGNSNERYMQGYSRDFLQSVKLFSWISDKKKKLIFLSSGGTVYGVQDKQPIIEEQLPLPINHYGTVKLCIENVIRTINVQANTHFLIARVSNPFGPGQDYKKGVGFVDAALKKAMNQEMIEIWGDGEIIRDYVYIEDVCAMIYSLIDYAGDEQVFNVSSNEGISLNIIINELRELGLNPNVVYKETRSVDVPKVILDNSKILSVYKSELKSFKEGLKSYYDYLRK